MSHTADINGLQLFYRDHGSGTPLLLLHGFMGTGDDWRHVFAGPLDGYRVITPDLRGHGRSTNPSGVFRFADVARDVLALLDRLGINRVKAIGMSAGANTLLHMATQQPSRIDALIHVSGTPRFPEPARAIMQTMTEESRSEAEWTEMRVDRVIPEMRDAWQGGSTRPVASLARTCGQVRNPLTRWCRGPR